MNIKVEVEVAKEAYELGQGLAKFSKAMRHALANGWQPGEDIPEVMTHAMTDLVPALSGAQEIPGEAAGDKAAFGRAISLGVVDAIFA